MNENKQLKALKVVALTKETARYLKANDPQCLKQVDEAIKDADGTDAEAVRVHCFGKDWHEDKAEFSDEELGRAFDLVKNKRGWKNPINAVVTKEQLACVEAAIIYFAGCMAEVTEMRNGKFRVRAVGYRAAVGG